MTSSPQEDPQTHPATSEEDAPEIVPGEKPEDGEEKDRGEAS
ncbi:hypothetical protein [Nocardioides mangrovicus]|nr:hypothetical protein [Nocardioides mangrovicus]